MAPSIGGPVAVDVSGNVFVNGEGGIIKYNSSGIQQWQVPGYGTAFAVDPSGNIYTMGQFDRTFYTINAIVKYNSAGVEQWADSTQPFYRASALAVDASGNVYVTGWIWGGAPGTSYDYLTVKWNSNGVRQWISRYTTQGYADDKPDAIVVDGSGNVYVTGYISNNVYGTVKYDSVGGQKWVASYSSGGYDFAIALAVDASGNVYVTGNSGPIGNSDYATVKYNASGVQQWVARYDGPGKSYDDASAIALDAAGNIYVTGSSADSNGFTDFATIKYNPSGSQQWIARYNGPEGYGDATAGIAVDGAGNVYVTGTSGGSSSIYTTIKYSQSGTPVLGGESNIPTNYGLDQNYPNPFNPNTVISYKLPVNSFVLLKIYDLLGREVATLVNEERTAGSYGVQWNAERFSSGVYFYKLEAGSFSQTRKLMLIR
jgi:hypothetical protein